MYVFGKIRRSTKKEEVVERRREGILCRERDFKRHVKTVASFQVCQGAFSFCGNFKLEAKNWWPWLGSGGFTFTRFTLNGGFGSASLKGRTETRRGRLRLVF